MSQTTEQPPAAAAESVEDLERLAAEQAAEAEQAAQMVAALEERVRDGDDTVDVDELQAAGRLARFAKLRVEGARRKAERAAQARREAMIADLAARVTDAVAPGGPAAPGWQEPALEAFRTAVAKAARKYVETHEQRRAHVSALFDAARALDAAEGYRDGDSGLCPDGPVRILYSFTGPSELVVEGARSGVRGVEPIGSNQRNQLLAIAKDALTEEVRTK